MSQSGFVNPPPVFSKNKGKDKKAIKNFGDQSVLELLAKLGIWMNAVERERER